MTYPAITQLLAITATQFCNLKPQFRHFLPKMYPSIFTDWLILLARQAESRQGLCSAADTFFLSFLF